MSHLNTLDILQARVISRIFAKSVSERSGNSIERMALKGGLAMRLANGHLRHTNDVDLDADCSMSHQSLEKTVGRAIKDALADGMLEDVKVTMPKDTDTTVRWKINGTIPDTKEPLHMKIEVSLRETLNEDDITTISDVDTNGKTNDGDVSIPVYKNEHLVAKKIAALFSSNRNAPRDIVDLNILFKSEVVVPSNALRATLAETLSEYHLKDNKEAVTVLWDKLSSMSKARFDKEVKPSLDNVADWDDWDSIRIMVGERIEQEINRLDDRPQGCKRKKTASM